MTWQGFKHASRRIVIELVVVAALGLSKPGLPERPSLEEALRFALDHPLLLLHILIATAILIEATALLIAALVSKSWIWIAWAGVGLATILVIYVSGARYIATRATTDLSTMGDVTGVALLVYGLGWLTAHRRAKAAA